MNMESEAEAFACVAVMVAGADGIGTAEEGHYLFDTMSKHPVFRDLEPAAFTDVLSRASRHVYAFGRAADGRLSDEGVSTILDQVRTILSADLCEQAVQMAFDLARADEMAEEEESLMQRLRRALLTEA